HTRCLSDWSSDVCSSDLLYQPQIVREVIGPDGSVVRPFKPKLIRKLDVSQSVLRTMREAARNVLLVRHTYNLVDLPIVIAGKSRSEERRVGKECRSERRR